MSVLLKRIMLIALLSGLMACASTAPTAESGNEDAQWVGTWAASPMESGDNAFAPAPSFVNQTLRQVVHGSVGGEAVRVRISNDYGEGDLVLGAASLALQDEGAQVRPGTHHELSFSGNSSITIPAGAYVLSDPVDISVDAFEDFMVSMYFPEDTGAVTSHAGGLQTSYISDAGDFTTAVGFPVRETTSSVFFLTGLEVLAGPAAEVLVAFGDSITDGTGSTQDANQRWPNLLARRLAEEGSAESRADIGVLNQGIAGNRLLHDMIGDNALARFDRDVMSWENLAHVVVMVGINDIGFSEIEDFPFGDEVDNDPVSADELIAGYRQLIERAHNHGVRIYGATLTPFKGASYYSEAGEEKRQAINTWIRESGAYDGVIDFDRAIRDPEDPQRMREDLHAGDWLHPNDAGYAVMAEAIDLSLFRSKGSE